MNETSAQRPDRPLADTNPMPAAKARLSSSEVAQQEAALAAAISATPRLPRGKALFENIPANAVVLDALGPAVQAGFMLLGEGAKTGVIWIAQNQVREIYAYLEGRVLLGEDALQEIRSWAAAEVSAFQLDGQVSDLIPAILRGRSCYADLRLSWVNWVQLQNDIASRQGTYVIELSTANGWGVTCFADGQRIATYTHDHLTPGAATLIDDLAKTGIGIIQVRSEAAAEIPSPELQAQITATSQFAARAEENPPESSEFSSWMTAPLPEPQPKPEPEPSEVIPPPVSQTPVPPLPPAAMPSTPKDDPFASFFADVSSLEGNGSPATPEVPVAQLLPDLKLIARSRLQRSADRVEGMLDAAAASSRPLSEVLPEIRSLAIRGVMQSTLDEMVEEMQALAASRG